MTTYTATTVPTQFVEANGIRFAYRRWGKRSGLPLVFKQHFTGNLENWDPAVLDGLAKEREVIIFNNAGVASSTGEVPMNRKQGRDKKGISGVITVLRPSAKLIVGPTSIRLDGPSS